MAGELEGKGEQGNRLIAMLPEEDASRLISRATSVSLERGQVLFERGQPLSEVFFPINSIASLLVLLEDGGAVEMATVGREGLVGISAFLANHGGIARGIGQVPGKALRLEVEAFREELERSPSLRRVLERYVVSLITLMGQTVACNRRHRIEQRCARWLLMARDRVDSDTIPLTQEFLAYMLGVRRQSVTEAAGRLQDQGLIGYRRGSVTIVDRDRLRDAACECYGVITQEFERLLPLSGERRGA